MNREIASVRSVALEASCPHLRAVFGADPVDCGLAVLFHRGVK
jgi:hypothetical protein